MANKNERGGLTPKPPNPSQLSAEVFEKLIEQQTEQIKLNQIELSLQEKAEANQFEFSKLALEAQRLDLTDKRKYNDKQMTKVALLIVAILIIIIGFLCFALYTGNSAIVTDFLKVVGGLIVGAIGGYGAGKSSKKKAKENEEEN